MYNYGIECYSLIKTQLKFLDFVITRMLMKFYKLVNTDCILILYC